MAHHQGDTYRLDNVGSATAHDVKATAHDTMMVRDLPDSVDLTGGEAAIFLAVMSMATQDSTISITWLDDPSASDRHEWRYPLPPRPPRR